MQLMDHDRGKGQATIFLSGPFVLCYIGHSPHLLTHK